MAQSSARHLPLPAGVWDVGTPESSRESLQGRGAQPRSGPRRHPDVKSVVVKGRAAIRALRPILVELAAMSGLAGSGDDFEHFMSLPSTEGRTPYLVLHPAGRGERSVGGINGATLLFELSSPIGRSRTFITLDDTGRRDVLAPPEIRAKVAIHAARALISRGAHLVLINFNLQEGKISYEKELAQEVGLCTQGVDGARGGLLRWFRSEAIKSLGLGSLWTHSQETVARYLSLERSYEQTVSHMSHKMRFNLGYYRRLAERELGSEFVPVAALGLAEFMTLSRASMYAVSDSMAEWRYHSLKRISDPLLCGVRDRDGRWLSVVGGRRQGRSVEIDWVMNRDGLRRFSLGTVVRSYLMEYECQRGTERFYLEGGTMHGTGRWFLSERVMKVAVRRRSVYVWLLTRLGKHFLARKHEVPRILKNPDLLWVRF